MGIEKREGNKNLLNKKRSKNNLIFVIAVLFILVFSVVLYYNYFKKEVYESPQREISQPKPNFVVFLTDDQRFDTIWAMENVQENLKQRGVTFSNAFVQTPLCCPSRASFLSGGFYTRNTNVLNNNLPNGGVEMFEDAETIGTLLQKEGYNTALIGKYLNNYEDYSLPYVPP